MTRRLAPGPAAATARPDALRLDERPVQVLFLVLPDTLLLDLAGPAEAFRLANQVLQRRGWPAAFDLRFVGPQPHALSSVGLTLGPLAPLPGALPQPCWVVLLGQPGPAANLQRRQPAWLEAREWLGRVVAPALDDASGLQRLLTVCAGALLAADAGLLGTRRCTTHHELLDDLAVLAPQAQVLANRVFVEDGPLSSSAGITAGIDLALQLIARRCGDALAASVAQVMVAAGRRGTLEPQRSPLLAHRDHLHPAVHRVQEALCQHPEQAWSAETMAEVACVTPRQLARLFRAHTGLTPRGYLEHVRLALAQQARTRGASTRQAADLGGFSSDRQWRRARARQG